MFLLAAFELQPQVSCDIWATSGPENTCRLWMQVCAKFQSAVKDPRLAAATGSRLLL